MPVSGMNTVRARATTSAAWTVTDKVGDEIARRQIFRHGEVTAEYREREHAEVGLSVGPFGDVD